MFFADFDNENSGLINRDNDAVNASARISGMFYSIKHIFFSCDNRSTDALSTSQITKLLAPLSHV